ncbi:MAG: acVLRF1 family peptidyl-tRNA hydrolase [Trebonia sp.]
MNNVAGSGARWLDVSAERFPGWISAFAGRHGDPGLPGDPARRGDSRKLTITPGDGDIAFTAPDGAVAQCHPPFGESFAVPPGLAGPDEVAAAIAAHARAPRAVGVLLVRLGGYAAGVFSGYPPALADSKVGSRLVHGRSAAGGWSQHRFARRREKQANEALDAAADTAVAVFGRGPRLDAVVLGGDKRTVAGLRDDPRLAPYLAIATERFLTVPDPRRAVLEGTPKLFTAVRIKLTEPPD